MAAEQLEVALLETPHDAICRRIWEDESGVGIHSSQQIRHRSLQRGNVPLDCLPHNPEIDPEVIVNQDVTKTAHRAPIHFRMQIFSLIGQSLRRLAEYLQITQNGVLQRVGIADGTASLRRILPNPPQAQQNVFEVCPIRFQSGMQSRCTDSRIYGLSDLRITT